MSTPLRYAFTALLGVSAIVAVLWPFLDEVSRAGVLWAAAIAWPVQAVAFAVLSRYRGALNGFLAAWVGGMFLRTAVVALVAFAVVRSGTEHAVPLLLALVGFLFGLLLLEPVYFRPGPSETVEA